MSKYTIDVTDSEFEDVVLKSEIPVLLDFHAAWCAPCKALSPVLEQLAEDYDGKVLIVKIDVDDNPQTSINYGVRNIPAMFFIKNGEIMDKQIGPAVKSVLAGKLDNLL